MRTLFLTLVAAAIILTGCSAPSQTPSAAQDTGFPKQGEVCLKPSDASGITIDLYKPQGHGTFRAAPGWTIARPAFNLMGAVRFPKAVDPSSVKISVKPAADWQAVKTEVAGKSAVYVDFNFLPAGANLKEPLMMQWGKPGWVTLTVESAKAADGTDVLKAPVSLKIFAYSTEMQASHPYLVECYGTLSVPETGGH